MKHLYILALVLASFVLTTSADLHDKSKKSDEETEEDLLEEMDKYLKFPPSDNDDIQDLFDKGIKSVIEKHQKAEDGVLHGSVFWQELSAEETMEETPEEPLTQEQRDGKTF